VSHTASAFQAINGWQGLIVLPQNISWRIQHRGATRLMPARTGAGVGQFRVFQGFVVQLLSHFVGQIFEILSNYRALGKYRRIMPTCGNELINTICNLNAAVLSLNQTVSCW
jgi:hypothetical protein